MIDSCSEICSLLSQKQSDPIQVDKYRWLNLFLFCLCSSVNALQCLQYSVISDIMARYYNVSCYTVAATATVYILSCILLFIPVSYIMENLNLRMIVMVSSGLTTIGVSVKLFSIPRNMFNLVLIGQFVCGVGQVFIMCTPLKLVAVWFAPNEVSTACTLSLFGNKFGTALQSILSPYLIRDSANSKDIANALFRMLLYTDLVAFLSFALIVALFRDKPKYPPSYSERQVLQSAENIIKGAVAYLDCIKNLISNKDFVCILVSFGIANGTWNGFIILLRTVFLLFRPGEQRDVGLVELISIVSGGCFGSLTFGYILDKTHKYKTLSFVVLLLASLMFLILTFGLIQKNRTLMFIAVTISGFFLGGQLGISFPYTIEVTYPESEIASCTLLNAVLLSFDILGAAMYSTIISAIGVFWSNIVFSVTISLCAFLTLKMSSRLRRNEANVSEHYIK